MANEEEAREIFLELKGFAIKHKAQFLCMINFTDENGERFLSNGEGNARKLIAKFLMYDKNSKLWK